MGIDIGNNCRRHVMGRRTENYTFAIRVKQQYIVGQQNYYTPSTRYILFFL